MSIQDYKSKVQADITESIRAYNAEEQAKKRKKTVSDAVEKIKKSIEDAERKERIERASKRAATKRELELDKHKKELEEQALLQKIRARKIKKIQTQKMEALSKQCYIEDHLVRYEAQNNCYYMDGTVVYRNPFRIKKSMREQFIKSNIGNIKIYDYIFDGLEQNPRKVIRECDPYILLMLAKKSPAMAKKYIYKLAGEPTYGIESDDFRVIYDVRGIDKIPSDELPLKDKIYTKRLIKSNQRAAHVLQDKKKAPWYAIIPMIGAIALGGIVGFFSQKNTDEDKSTSENYYTATINPDDSEDDRAWHSTYIETTTQDLTEASISYSEVNVESTDEAETNTEVTTDPSENDQDKIIETTPHQDENEKSEPENNDENSEVVSIKIGDKINVTDGIKYTANCLGGGNSNEIGAVSWRPSAYYYVDGVAFIHNGEVLSVNYTKTTDIKETLSNLACQYGVEEIEIETSVLISLTPGSGDTGWARIDITSAEKCMEQDTNNYQRSVQPKSHQENER